MRQLTGQCKVIEADQSSKSVETAKETVAGTTYDIATGNNVDSPSYLNIQGINFYPGDELHFEDGKISRARLTGERTIRGNFISSGKEVVTVKFDLEGRITDISGGAVIVNGIAYRSGLFFHPTGQIANGRLEKPAIIEGISLGPYQVFFYPDGKLWYGILAENQVVQGFSLVANSGVILFPDGSLDTGTLTYAQSLKANFLYDNELQCDGTLSLHNNGMPHVVKLAKDQLGERAGTLLHFDQTGRMTGYPPPPCSIRQGHRINLGAVLREQHCNNPEPAKAQPWIILQKQPDNRLLRSQNSVYRTRFQLKNTTRGSVTVYWRDFAGNRQQYACLQRGASLSQETFATHVWEVVSASGEILLWFVAGAQSDRIIELGD